MLRRLLPIPLLLATSAALAAPAPAPLTLEALAARVAAICLERFGAARATVRLTKQNLAWPTGGRVAVEVSRP